MVKTKDKKKLRKEKGMKVLSTQLDTSTQNKNTKTNNENPSTNSTEHPRIKPNQSTVETNQRSREKSPVKEMNIQEK